MFNADPSRKECGTQQGHIAATFHATTIVHVVFVL